MEVPERTKTMFRKEGDFLNLNTLICLFIHQVYIRYFPKFNVSIALVQRNDVISTRIDEFLVEAHISKGGSISFHV